MDGAGKLVAAICHRPWVLISAGLAKGRNMMTCYAGIKDDLKNAGALYEDKPVVVFDNMITSMKTSRFTSFLYRNFEIFRKNMKIKTPEKSCLEGEGQKIVTKIQPEGSPLPGGLELWENQVFPMTAHTRRPLSNDFSTYFQ